MEFENKKLRDVADIAARIMMGEKALHPNQQKLDVHEPEKDELTAKDFEKLRKMKKEEVEEVEEERLDELSVNKMLTYRSKATEKLGSDPSKDEKRKEGIRVSGEKVKAKVGQKQKEINAKYDAELKALEEIKTAPKPLTESKQQKRIDEINKELEKLNQTQQQSSPTPLNKTQILRDKLDNILNNSFNNITGIIGEDGKIAVVKPTEA
jgi:hypothetical protein